MRLLLINDDRPAGETTKDILERDGHAVDLVPSGEDGEAMAGLIHYAVLIVDIDLAQQSGPEVCDSLRRKNRKTPILILSYLDSRIDVRRGLDSGADDYIVKPFDTMVMLGRVRALSRRAPVEVYTVLKAGALVVDTGSRDVHYDGIAVNICGLEYRMLVAMMRQPESVASRQYFETHAWDMKLDSKSNIVDEHIKNLRAKLAAVAHENLIETVRGVGYRLNMKALLRKAGPPIIVFLTGLFFTLQSQMDWLVMTGGGDG
jgi:two-component system, OmpR family, response regulator